MFGSTTAVGMQDTGCESLLTHCFCRSNKI